MLTFKSRSFRNVFHERISEQEYTKFGTQFSYRHRDYLLRVQQCDTYFINKYRLLPFLRVTEFPASKLHPISRIPYVLTAIWTARDENITVITEDKYGKKMGYTNFLLLQAKFETESRSLSLPYRELVFVVITLNLSEL